MPAPLELEVVLGDITVNTAQLSAYVRGENSEVFRQLVKAGEAIRQEAIRIAPVSQPDPIPRRKPRRPGTLRDSIVKRVGTDARGPFIRVGVGGTEAAKYALYVHEGTVPHPINARRAPLLVFDWHGRTVRTRSVNHPGNAPNRFLVRAAISVLGAGNTRS